MQNLTLLALSGSLRKTSRNTAALQALQLLNLPEVKIVLGNIAELPLFNPDREDEYIPALMTLKKQLADADGLIIASPEYAHGISGPLKNALDWLVSGAEFPAMPIMLLNTSPRASHAQQALREVLRTMSGIVIEDACLSLPLLGSSLDAAGINNDPTFAAALQRAITVFRQNILTLQEIQN